MMFVQREHLHETEVERMKQEGEQPIPTFEPPPRWYELVIMSAFAHSTLSRKSSRSMEGGSSNGSSVGKSTELRGEPLYAEV